MSKEMYLCRPAANGRRGGYDKFAIFTNFDDAIRHFNASVMIFTGGWSKKPVLEKYVEGVPGGTLIGKEERRAAQIRLGLELY